MIAFTIVERHKRFVVIRWDTDNGHLTVPASPHSTGWYFDPLDSASRDGAEACAVSDAVRNGYSYKTRAQAEQDSELAALTEDN